MIKNKDLNAEVWQLFRDSGLTVTAVSARMGIVPQHFYRILKREQIQSAFVKMVDALGYDIEVKFVKKR